MGVELPPDFNLDSIDPYAPTEEQLAILAGGHGVKINFYRKNPAKLQAEIAYLKGKQAEAAVAFDPADIPEPEIHRSEGDAELDAVLERIDVLQAYTKWIPKNAPDPRGKTKNIMVSCPFPHHPDNKPSADLNLEKGEGGVWHCHACDEGGDKYDLAAIGLGYAYTGGAYKRDGTFPQLRRDMAAEFGYVVKREHGVTTVTELEVVIEPDDDDDGPEPGGRDPQDDHLDPEHGGHGGNADGGVVPDVEGGSDRVDGLDRDGEGREPVDRLPDEVGGPVDGPVPEDTSAGAPTPADHPPLRLVVPDPFLPPDPLDRDEAHTPADPIDRVTPVPEPLPIPVELRPSVEKIGEFDLVSAVIDWKAIVPDDTFIYEYMVQNCRFDIPHEFHLWNALQLIAFANGYHIRVQDVPPISGNLFVVLLGQTGLGKSRSVASMRYLLNEVLPWTGTKETPGTGVKILGGVESGQALIKGMGHEYEDPSSSVPGAMINQEGVLGWTMPEEFAGFVKKAMRSGSDFKERAIEFYDSGKTGVVSTTSIKAGGEVKAVGPFLQVTSTTQPEAIHTYLAAEDAVSGFLNRFVFVSGPSRDVRPARWLDTDAPDLAKSAAGLRMILAFAQANDGLLLPWTADGSAAWDRMFVLVEKQKLSVGPMAVRLDLLLKKIMLLFALNEHKTAIDADLVDRMEPVMQHLVACYARITGELYWRSDDDCQNAILKYVFAKNEAGAHPSRKEIVDTIKRPTEGRSRFDIMRALDVLDRLEMLTMVKVRKGERGPEKNGYKITEIGGSKAARS